MEIELARHQWEEGRRALERGGPVLERRLAGQVDAVGAELTRRLGQIYSLEALAALYEHADGWAFELLHDALAGETPLEASLVTDAAFALAARRATDYAP